ncbi:DNA primase [Segatella oulorum]|uniref:DNA primase n=1 Tax=Segatella oulorum TaxID=28136 RepID=A0A1T4MYC5_9BACT|nr:DNA primase [Segatella oulorum]SJZ71775.1 DNA primase [Segatella oulorum]
MAIDKQTIEKIKDAANIVDVVSEFVTLRKSGSNYKGLCPFHNEKTPSFIVSPARGTCHCFGCGRGGNPIGFIMEHEQVTYPEALRWLAKKYHIEIRERELSDEERKEQSLRESMFIVNEWAATYFEDILHNHVDGVAIGMQYFRSRGFRDDIIRKFRLGFDLPDRQALAHAALQKGYQAQFLLNTGICYQNDHNELIDRYANRVIFPWVGVSGKIVGFGGRVLDARTKGVNQKYVNSPDSEIYHKDHELYGIYQAKRAIAKEDNVYMVEGYTDVISMHQCGIENVVANSGTALSVHQIQMLHRFTNNITLLYDGDAAGIHAALRGTDMLLLEGMNLKVLLLPNNEDPDSFARQHTADEFKTYIEAHATDFIRFKTALLLDNENDPLKRSEAINSIVMSISMVQNPILRDTYLHDCAQRIGMNEMTLINQMNALIRERKASGSMRVATPATSAEQQQQIPVESPAQSSSNRVQTISEVEKFILQLIIKYGNRVIFPNVDDSNGNVISLTIAEFIHYNLGCDNLSFSSELLNQILQEAVEKGTDRTFQTEPYFVHHNDIQVSNLAIEMAEEKFKLSESQQVKDDEESLRNRVKHLMLDFRRDYVEKHLVAIKAQIAQAHGERQMALMGEYQKLIAQRNKLAKELGSNIIV